MSALKTCILLLFLSLPAQAKDAAFLPLTVYDGLPNNTVYNVMQDSRGFLWFSTETGVGRYDGRKFDLFTTADGLADNENFKSFEDSRHRIWFLSYNGKLSYYHQGVIHNPANTSWLNTCFNNGSLLDIAEDNAGNIWIISSLNEALKLSGTSVIRYEPFGDRTDITLVKSLLLENGFVKRYVVDTLGNLYLADLLSQKKQFIGRYNNLPHIRSFLPGYAYTPSAKGIIVSGMQHAGLLPPMINVKTLSCLPERDALWVGTDGNGLIKISSTTVERYLQGTSVTSIFKDIEGNLWITTLGDGVYILKNNYKATEVLSGDPTFSISILPNGSDTSLVAGLGNGSIKIIRKHHTEIVRLSEFAYNRIKGIIPLTGHSILLYADKGVYEYDIDKKTTLHFNILSTKSYGYASGVYWLCTPLSIYRLKNRQYYSAINNTGLYRYTAVAPLADSICYIGTTKGLYKVTGKTFNTVISDTVLHSGVKDLKWIDGQLWVATHGNGLFIIRCDTIWKCFNTTNSGIVSDFCQKLYYDDKERVWIATNKGLSVFNRKDATLFYNVAGNQWLSSDDVKDVVVNGAYTYIATANGINKIETGKALALSPPPHVYITSIEKNNKKSLDPGNNIEFTYFKGILNIGFTTAAFLSPSRLMYEYKFAGETQWHKIQATELPLFSLEPGTYTLLFRAKKYNSAWGRPTMLSIVVNPTFIQSAGFKLLLLFILAGIIYLAGRSRIRYIRKREQEKNEAQKKILELESKALSCQMNPHFIFNSLNTVQQFILVQDEEQGLNYLAEFAILMRQILENSKKPVISLGEEAMFLERYLQLEQVRYNNKFNYAIDIDPALDKDEVKLPPVLFQPLLENAIKHGVSASSDGFIELKMRSDNGYLVGTVEDNGIGIGKSARGTKRSSSALKIIEERLKLTKSNKGATGYMTIFDKCLACGKGTLVTINIPI